MPRPINPPGQAAPLDIRPIGHVRSCFPEKFGIPRQPGLIPGARGTIVIHPPYHTEQAFAGLERFSHIWVLFLFHQAVRADWKPSVRPPRLGGNRRLGVFASRSPFRPNHIGMSPLALEGIEFLEGETRLHVQGLDLVDGTPVLDIKPYVPYVDAIPQAQGGYADSAPQARLRVEFETDAAQACQRLEASRPGLAQLIRDTIAQDPRPAYLAGQSEGQDGREFGLRLYDLNIRWRVHGDRAEVVRIEKAEERT